jgi:hypothetical protein
MVGERGLPLGAVTGPEWDRGIGRQGAFVIVGLVVTAIITEHQPKTLGTNRLFFRLVNPLTCRDCKYPRQIQQTSGEVVFVPIFH